MKLFTVGPVQMYPFTLATSAKQLPYFRDQEFSDRLLSMEQQLKELVNLKDGKAVFLTGSGTAAMESLIACSYTSANKVLIINGGSFGARFVELCTLHHIPFDEYRLTYPAVFKESELYQFDGTQYDALLVNLHETSIGQLYPIDVLSAYAKTYHLDLVVDAISTCLADPYDMDTYGIDATILSSQKALACAPGAACLLLNQSFIEKRIQPNNDTTMYLSIKDHMRNMERGQTPFTPSVGVLLQMEEMIQHILTIEKATWLDEIAQRATYFRSRVKELPAQIPDYPLSNALTPIYFKEPVATMLFEELKKRYDIYVTPSGGALKDHLLRIGHLGNLTIEDYDELITHIKEILQ